MADIMEVSVSYTGKVEDVFPNTLDMVWEIRFAVATMENIFMGVTFPNKQLIKVFGNSNVANGIFRLWGIGVPTAVLPLDFSFDVYVIWKNILLLKSAEFCNTATGSNGSNDECGVHREKYQCVFYVSHFFVSKRIFLFGAVNRFIDGFHYVVWYYSEDSGFFNNAMQKSINFFTGAWGVKSIDKLLTGKRCKFG